MTTTIHPAMTPPDPPNDRMSHGTTGHRANWMDIRLAYQDRHSAGHWFAMALMLGVALTGAMLDAHLMEPVFRRVLRLNVDSAQRFSYGVAAVMVALMAGAGHGLRGLQGNPATRKSVGAYVLYGTLTVWAGVGVAIAAMRYQVTTAGSPTLVAVGFFAIYLATGLLAAYDMYNARNDAFTRRQEDARKLKPLQEQLIAQEAQLHLVQRNLANAVEDFAAITKGADYAKQSHAALIAQLKQLSIQNLGAAQGSSAMMGVTSAQHPLNPAYRADEPAGGQEES